MKTIKECQIGTFKYFTENGRMHASFSCELKKKRTINIIVLDELGRMKKETTFLQPKGFSIIKIDLYHLQEGKYNFWIEIGKQTLIREMNIPVMKKKGWLERLKAII